AAEQRREALDRLLMSVRRRAGKVEQREPGYRPRALAREHGQQIEAALVGHAGRAAVGKNLDNAAAKLAHRMAERSQFFVARHPARQRTALEAYVLRREAHREAGSAGAQ